MKRVQIESPYKYKTRKEKLLNERYARAALRDCLMKGEAPFASHLLYTQKGVLDDEVDSDRDIGIEAGLSYVEVSDFSAVYVDLGVRPGMRLGIDRAEKAGKAVVFRTIPGWDS